MQSYHGIVACDRLLSCLQHVRAVTPHHLDLRVKISAIVAASKRLAMLAPWTKLSRESAHQVGRIAVIVAKDVRKSIRMALLP